ncbi:hypothetical protein PA598K_00169 [Paenibacillus sp. 598K]|uniref:hypothetical protein n=1 Tax=Paenibacillus sp. 598K TaxID=1117987 RepID=UPI000FF9B64A|nr:hypothetical protein [Paenibacillus sp. 598K]GBF71941.1 hypothetical protein PA598K_00169 [Paenibacillus sp. 598K]
MKLNPIGISLFSTILMVVGFVLYRTETGNLGLPLLIVGLFLSVASVVVRWSQMRKQQPPQE